MKKLVIGLAVVLTLALTLGTALAAETMPSAKIAAAIGGINVLQQASSSAGTPGSADSGWDTILRTYIKTPNQKELLFNVSLESGIYTQTKVSSKRTSEVDTSTDTSTATGAIKVRVKVTDPNGNVRYAVPNQNTARDAAIGADGVVFNYRKQSMTAQFMGIFTGNCLTVNPDTHEVTIDYNCLTPETLDLLIDTLEANSFNFLLPDVVPGIQKVEVEAQLTASATSQTGTSEAKAAIGLGALVVESVRMIKGADIGTLQ